MKSAIDSPAPGFQNWLWPGKTYRARTLTDTFSISYPPWECIRSLLLRAIKYILQISIAHFICQLMSQEHWYSYARIMSSPTRHKNFPGKTSSCCDQCIQHQARLSRLVFVAIIFTCPENWACCCSCHQLCGMWPHIPACASICDQATETICTLEIQEQEGWGKQASFLAWDKLH